MIMIYRPYGACSRGCNRMLQICRPYGAYDFLNYLNLCKKFLFFLCVLCALCEKHFHFCENCFQSLAAFDFSGKITENAFG